MPMSRHRCAVVMAVWSLCWAGLTGSLFADTVPGALSEVRQLTMDEADQNEPRINGDYIVWTDYRNDPDCPIDNLNDPCWKIPENTDIFLYKISTNTTTQVTTNSRAQETPDISNNTIVWVDYRNANADDENSDIYYQTIEADGSLAATQALVTQRDDQDAPRIDGPLVAWLDDRDANGEAVFWKNLSTNTSGSYVDGDVQPTRIAVSGDTIVFEDTRNSPHCPLDNFNDPCWDQPQNVDLYGLTVGGAVGFPVLLGPDRQSNPAISGNTVIGTTTVYDNRGKLTSGTLTLHRMENGSEQLLTTPRDIEVKAEVSGSLYIYHKCPADANLPCGLWAGDLSTGVHWPLVEETPNQYLGDYDIDGSRVVWIQCVVSDGTCDVYYGVINHPPVLQPIPSQTIARSATLQFDVHATDADGTVTYSATGLPAGATLNSSTGHFNWTVPAGQLLGNTTVTFQARDQYGATATGSVLITVISVPLNPPTVTITNPVDGQHVNDIVSAPIGCTFLGMTPMWGTVTTSPGTVLDNITVIYWGKSSGASAPWVNLGTFSGAFATRTQTTGWSGCCPIPRFDYPEWKVEVHAQSYPAASQDGKAAFTVDASGIVHRICHILTAAFGRPDAPAIRTLWVFHHRLLGNQWNAPWHQAYLRWYDANGPKIAAWLQDKPWLKAAIRAVATAAARIAD